MSAHMRQAIGSHFISKCYNIISSNIMRCIDKIASHMRSLSIQMR